MTGVQTCALPICVQELIEKTRHFNQTSMHNALGVYWSSYFVQDGPSVEDVFTCMNSGFIGAFIGLYKKPHSARLGPLLFQTFYQKNVFLGTTVLDVRPAPHLSKSVPIS